MPELDFASAIETNWIKLGTLEMEATGEKMIVIQDEFRFGTECTACGAKDIRMISQTEQRSVVECPDCLGSGRVRKAGNKDLTVKCSTCEARGWVVCPACNGTGTEAGLIAHPQDRERRPTTGMIVSKGDRVTKYNRGDSIIYPSYCGDFWTLEAEDIHGQQVTVVIGIISENDAIARVKGHLELRRVKSRKALHTAA